MVLKYQNILAQNDFYISPVGVGGQCPKTKIDAVGEKEVRLACWLIECCKRHCEELFILLVLSVLSPNYLIQTAKVY